MPAPKAPVTTTEEIGVILGLAQEVASYLGHTYADGDAHTSAMIVANWLEILYTQVARRAEHQLRGQLRMFGD